VRRASIKAALSVALCHGIGVDLLTVCPDLEGAEAWWGAAFPGFPDMAGQSQQQRRELPFVAR
jgi:hypothetical protein